MAKDDDKKPKKDTDKGRKRSSAYKLEDPGKKKTTAAKEDVAPAKAEAAPAEEAVVDDTVGDLNEAREAQAEEPGILDGLGNNVRNSVRQYLLDNVVPEGQTSGKLNVNIDAGFLKEHGPKLVSSIAQSLFKAVVPSKLEMSVPLRNDVVAEEKGQPASAAEDAGDDKPTVSVNLDLGNFFKSLFTPAAPSPEREEEGGDETEKDED